MLNQTDLDELKERVRAGDEVAIVEAKALCDSVIQNVLPIFREFEASIHAAVDAIVAWWQDHPELAKLVDQLDQEDVANG